MNDVLPNLPSNQDHNHSIPVANDVGARNGKTDAVAMLHGVIRIAEIVAAERSRGKREVQTEPAAVSRRVAIGRRKNSSVIPAKSNRIKKASGTGEELVATAAWSAAVVALCYRLLLDPRQRLTLRSRIDRVASALVGGWRRIQR